MSGPWFVVACALYLLGGVLVLADEAVSTVSWKVAHAIAYLWPVFAAALLVGLFIGLARDIAKAAASPSSSSSEKTS